MGLALAVTLMVLITSIEEANNPFKFDFESFDSDVPVKERELMKWREEYSHPLLLNSGQ